MFSLFRKNKTPITTLFTENFIDIHAHLLPGIDDGAKNLEESVSLIQRLQSYGIKNMVTTPHIMESVYENNPTIIQAKLNELKRHLKEVGIHDFEIRAAAEYMLDSHFNKLLQSEEPLLTIKNQFILVELSYINPPMNLYEILFNIQIAGYKPILAHPERYAFFHDTFEEYSKLKDAGCFFQLNLLALSNYYGSSVSKIALKLLEENKYDFVGTDTHHIRHLDFLEKINNTKVLKLVTPILENNVLLK